MNSVENTVVVITGGAGGIGTETAKLFSLKHACLVLADMDASRLETTANICKNNGAKEVMSVVANVAVMTDLQNIFKKTMERFNKIDVLVNNVGFAVSKPFRNIAEKDYDSTMDVNLKATFFLTQLFLPELIKSKGNIVNLSSAASINPEPRFMDYSVAKAGIDHFTRSLAREVAPKGVKVNAINPGPVKTAFHPDHEALKKIEAQQPLCGLLEPEMIARWVVFLSSAESGPVTGLTILVDGGRTVTRIPESYGPVR